MRSPSVVKRLGRSACCEPIIQALKPQCASNIVLGNRFSVEMHPQKSRNAAQISKCLCDPIHFLKLPHRSLVKPEVSLGQLMPKERLHILYDQAHPRAFLRD